MICPRCATDNPSQARYCKACGAELPSKSTGGFRWIHGLLAVLIGVLVALAVIGIIFAMRHRLVGNTAEREEAQQSGAASITLHVNRTAFEQGREMPLEVTLTAPSDIMGAGILVRDDEGETVANVAIAKMERDEDDDLLTYTFETEISHESDYLEGEEPGEPSFTIILIDDDNQAIDEAVIPIEYDDAPDTPEDERTSDISAQVQSFEPIIGLPFTYGIPDYWEGRVDQDIYRELIDGEEWIFVYIYPIWDDLGNGTESNFWLVNYVYRPRDEEDMVSGDIGTHCLGRLEDGEHMLEVWTNNWAFLAAENAGVRSDYENGYYRAPYSDLVDLSTGGKVLLDDALAADLYAADDDGSMTDVFMAESEFSEQEVIPRVRLL